MYISNINICFLLSTCHPHIRVFFSVLYMGYIQALVWVYLSQSCSKVVYQVLIINFKHQSVKTVLLSLVFLLQRMLSFVTKKCNTGRSLNPIKVFVKLRYKIFYRFLSGKCLEYVHITQKSLVIEVSTITPQVQHGLEQEISANTVSFPTNKMYQWDIVPLLIQLC